MCMSKRVRGNVCLILCGVLVWFLADAGQLRLEAAKALAYIKQQPNVTMEEVEEHE